jgi:uncharacterized protein YndB with AHSA1/START domain
VADLIERELRLEASCPEAWRALTDPHWLSAWLADEVDVDWRPGGEARFLVDGELLSGWVEEVTPPSPDDSRPGRLAFWWARGAEPATRVELVLTVAANGGVRLRVLETRPLEILDLVGMPLPGANGRRHGPALVAA